MHVALGIEGVTEAVVKEMCSVALLHKFVHEDLDEHGVVLGGNRGSRMRLSGGVALAACDYEA